MRSKNGKWECKHGCDQAAYLAKHGTGCPHLEQIIGPAKQRLDSKRILVTTSFDRLPISLPSPISEDDAVDEEEALRAKLRQYGVTKKKIEVLIDRLVKGKTFKEIARELGYSQASNAHRAYNDTLKQLKRRGYGS